jgi:uncharacterized protein YxjI
MAARGGKCVRQREEAAMEAYEVTQKLLSFGPAYVVRRTDAGAAATGGAKADGSLTIQGKLLTTSPRLTLLDGDGRSEIASMRGNFAKTKFDCFDATKVLIATLAFPLFAIKKGFTITCAGKTYKADGGFRGGEFTCKSDAGDVVLTIRKQLSIRETFAVTSHGVLPRDVALMAAVAIDQKFFQDD